VIEYCQGLTRYGTIITDVPDIRGVVRDPNDMIIACAVAAGADYIVTRDKDLLSLGEYEGIAMIKPEAFLHILRGQASA
jgi:predicted nucleic acid-binding protein